MKKYSMIRFDYRDLSNEQHVTYTELIMQGIEKFNPAALGIESLYLQYKAAFLAEVEILDIVRKSEFTRKLVEQDQERDTIIHGFTAAVKSAVCHYNRNFRDYGKNLDMVLKSYGDIAGRSYDKETAAIDDLLRELNDSRSNEIVTLGFTPWLTCLQNENNIFKNLMSRRYVAKAQLPTLRMPEGRRAVDKFLTAIKDYFELLSLMPEQNQWEDFRKEINAISLRFKHILAQEEGIRKANKNNN